MRCAARCVFFPAVERDTQGPLSQPDFDLDTVIEKRLERDAPETVKIDRPLSQSDRLPGRSMNVLRHTLS